MDRRALVIATLMLAALISALPSTGAAVEVLLLPDSLGAGTRSLVKALKKAGHTVVVGPIEYTWDGTNPPVNGFDVVVHLNGEDYAAALPIAGQKALVEFVRSGGGYVAGQWNGFEAHFGLLIDMEDLVLQLWSDLWPDPGNCSKCSMTWTIFSGQEEHPVLDGVPISFTFFADGHNAGPMVVFEGLFKSVVLMTSPGGGPAVTVREFEGGRVVAFSSAANYRGFDNVVSDLTFQDQNIQRLYINAVSWAASELTEPTESTMDALMEAVAELEKSGALKKGQANALMSKLNAAARQIDRGNFNASESQMWAFVNQVEAWIRSGVLTQEDGGSLLAIADDIIADLAG